MGRAANVRARGGQARTQASYQLILSVQTLGSLHLFPPHPLNMTPTLSMTNQPDDGDAAGTHLQKTHKQTHYDAYGKHFSIYNKQWITS